MALEPITAEAPKPKPPHWLRVVLIGRRPGLTLIRICVTAAVLFGTAHYLLIPIRVQGPSMRPTYRDNGVNLVNRAAYWSHEPRRGDIVAIRFAGPSIMLMKRVVGLPGETVEFVGGRLFINGKFLEEPYVKFPCNWDYPLVTLDTNQYFVVGDNRAMPVADHTFGRVERERILGRILL